MYVYTIHMYLYMYIYIYKLYHRYHICICKPLRRCQEEPGAEIDTSKSFMVPQRKGNWSTRHRAHADDSPISLMLMFHSCSCCFTSLIGHRIL